MFPFQGAWPSSGLFQDFDRAPYSDDEDYYYSRGMLRQHGKKQGDGQHIKYDATKHPSAQAQAYNNSSTHPTRPVTKSAPTSPYSQQKHLYTHYNHQYQQEQQEQHRHQQQQPYQRQQHQQQHPRAMPVHTGPGTAAAGGGGRHAAHLHQTQPGPVPGAAPRKPPGAAAARPLSPDAAATCIQKEWRRARLARHRPALKELAAAAAKLRQQAEQLHAVQQEQAGMPLTQKQYLELSEPVMKVLFSLDAISCGGAEELRTKRKELSIRANKLLDQIQAAHKAQPGAGAGGSSGSAAAAGAAAAAQQPQKKKSSMGQWFKR